MKYIYIYINVTFLLFCQLILHVKEIKLHIYVF